MLASLTVVLSGQKNLSGPLKAGAAEIDITPSEDKLPGNFPEGILDRMHSRAIVLDNGITGAALVSVDIGGMHELLWMKLSQRNEKELWIPTENVMLTPSHTHSALFSASDEIEDMIFASVRQARDELQPAQVSYGAGISYINVNRDLLDPDTRLWREGGNYEGPSDHSVAVVNFETPDGDPIAGYYNYSMHATVAGPFLSQLTADVPGSTSRYIEDNFDDRIVALWSTGACGDQSPRYLRQT